MPQSLSQQELCSRLPHAGSMCLLDSVIDHDENSIRCASTTHLNPANPLRNREGLGSLNGIEYAAQAMAIHRSLLQESISGQKGYLVGVRNIKVTQQWLDQQTDELIIEANLLGASDEGAIYNFSLSSAQDQIISGRVIIMSSQESSL